MINWKQIKEDRPIQFKEFKAWLEKWMKGTLVDSIEDFFALPVYYQVGVFYEYQSKIDPDLQMIDRCVEIENYFNSFCKSCGLKLTPELSITIASDYCSDSCTNSDVDFIPKVQTLIKQLGEGIITVFGDSGAIALAYAYSALFRSEIMAMMGEFPMFCLYGEAASGKTLMMRSIMNIFQISVPHHSMGISASVLQRDITKKPIVCVEDFNDRANMGLVELIKASSWLGDSSFMINSQKAPLEDIGLFKRSITVQLIRGKRTIQCKSNLKALQILGQDKLIPSIIPYLLRYRAYLAENIHTKLVSFKKEINQALNNDGYIIDNRFVLSHSILLSVFSILQQKVELGINQERFKTAIYQNIISMQNTMTIYS